MICGIIHVDKNDPIGNGSPLDLTLRMEFDQWEFTLTIYMNVNLPLDPFIGGYINSRTNIKIIDNVDGWTFLSLLGYYNRNGKLLDIWEVRE